MTPTYTIKHVGINHDTLEETWATAETLERLFHLKRGKEGPLGVFSGSIFEVMKPGGRGTRGHIALQTEDVELAMEDLSSMGVTFAEETIHRNEDGRICFVYLEQEFSGFAVHLTL